MREREDNSLDNIKTMSVDKLIIEIREIGESLNKRQRDDPEGEASIPLLLRISFLIEELKTRGYNVISQKTFLIFKKEDGKG